jgi:hypothetical protein
MPRLGLKFLISLLASERRGSRMRSIGAADGGAARVLEARLVVSPIIVGMIERLEHFHVSWKHENALAFCFNAFSSREPVPLRLKMLS